jgi:hypothetical protein
MGDAGMPRQFRGLIVWLLLAAVSFAISVLAISGVILKNDTVGQVIWCVMWGLVGISWLGRFYVERKKAQQASSGETGQPSADER